ncbi:unnamed protein product [Owenia fusiformis]|uniref:Lengsin n=1 Tax=Owenia fusiformis TaxID=6347 RepID=A0A8J1XTU9_OWEFU|nr:unnamed protein product [Owenia fusiformis]
MSFPFNNLKDLEQLAIKAGGCEYIRFSFTDFNGISRSKIIPRRHFAKFSRVGMGMYAGTMAANPLSEVPAIPRVMELGHPDAILVPQPGTFHELPWAANGKYKMGEVLCETYWNENSPQEACPRAVAGRQVARLRELGYKIMAASEIECQMLDEATLEPVFPGQDAFVSNVMANFEELLCDIDSQLHSIGMDTETFQTEYGPGMFEITMNPVYDMDFADNCFIIKQGIKEICQNKKIIATFMSAPFEHYKQHPDFHAFIGAHFNHSVWDIGTGKNIFYDGTKANRLSDIANYWIAGILAHAPALTALQCPTVNCSRRMGQSWCPDKSNWGIGSRESMLRVKNASESGTYIENRLPSGAANPYLILASTIAAGIDGIKNKIQLPKEADPDGPALPRSLDESLKILHEDTVICEAFGQEFIEWFTIVKRDTELANLKEGDPSPEAREAERQMYLRLI